jgi:hypothetical protein
MESDEGRDDRPFLFGKLSQASAVARPFNPIFRRWSINRKWV